MKIGVMVESFRLGLEGGLKAAAEVGADGVQMYATGEQHPDKLDASARADLKKTLADLDLEMAAVCGDFGGHGFAVAADNPQRVEDSRKVVDLTVELGCKVVTTHIGVVPPDPSHPRYAVMAGACRQLAEYGKAAGVTFAIETGPETAIVLKKFIDHIGIPEGLGVNFDPANLVMVCREDIPRAVELLGPYTVHTHAKDGVNLKPVDPEQLYGAFTGEASEDFKWTDYIKEVPLGEGDVNFETYLPALRKAGFDGYLTIEREVGDDPRRDIEQAVVFLKGLLAG